MEHGTGAYPPTPRPGTALPLIVAGAALFMTAYLLWDRFVRPTTIVQPRVVTPRGELADFEKATIAIYDENRPSVVHITTKGQVRTSMFGWSTIEGEGSGFVWDAEGHIVTNFHVIRNATQDIRVYFHDSSRSRAVVIGQDPNHDIAVLRVLRKPPELRPILVGSAHGLKVGQSVFAIGNPFGLDQTLTTGVVSALDRSIRSVVGTTIRGVIQIDAAINPGNSGGPLLDSAGRLIGMNTAIYSKGGDSAGIGFAVPADTINEVVSRLLAHRKPAGVQIADVMLGVELEPVALPDTAPFSSATAVTRVVPGYGAELAGLHPFRLTQRGYLVGDGDFIVAVEGKRVSNAADVRRLLKKHKPGEQIGVKLLRERGGEFRIEQVSIELRKRQP